VKKEYWIECIASSLEEHGVQVTSEQIESIAEDIGNAHDNIGMSFHVPENPLSGEVKKLEKQLAREKTLVHCQKCNGNGCIQEYGPYHGSNTECCKCRGEGKHLP